MRLDKFLFFCRITKTRALAQNIISAGHVRIDGQPVTTAHHAIRPGQVITFPIHDQVRVLRVEALPTRRGPASEAKTHYCDLLVQSPD